MTTLLTDETSDIKITVTLAQGDSLLDYDRVGAFVYHKPSSKPIFIGAYSSDIPNAENPPTGLTYESLTATQATSTDIILTFIMSRDITSGILVDGDSVDLYADIVFIDSSDNAYREGGILLAKLEKSVSEGMG